MSDENAAKIGMATAATGITFCGGALLLVVVGWLCRLVRELFMVGWTGWPFG